MAGYDDVVEDDKRAAAVYLMLKISHVSHAT